MQRPTEDRFLITFSELKDRMVVLMAGRAAEQLIFDEVSTGASDDLAKVTDIARECVTRFGMTSSVGQAVLEKQSGQYLDQQSFGLGGKDYSEETAREVDLAVRKLIDEAYDQAKAILTEHLQDLKARCRPVAGERDDNARGFCPDCAKKGHARRRWTLRRSHRSERASKPKTHRIRRAFIDRNG